MKKKTIFVYSEVFFQKFSMKYKVINVLLKLIRDVTHVTFKTNSKKVNYIIEAILRNPRLFHKINLTNEIRSTKKGLKVTSDLMLNEPLP